MGREVACDLATKLVGVRPGGFVLNRDMRPPRLRVLGAQPVDEIAAQSIADRVQVGTVNREGNAGSQIAEANIRIAVAQSALR